MQEVEESEKCKKKETNSSDASVSSQLNGHRLKKKKMYETRKIGGLISLLESALPKRLGLASVSSFLTLPVTQIFFVFHTQLPESNHSLLFFLNPFVIVQF